MSSLKHNFIENIDRLINFRLQEISLALKIQLIKTDGYDAFVKKVYCYVSHEISKFVTYKLANLDNQVINNRLNELINIYLMKISKE